ncbi:MAG TPA: T9SS type A sorting domain-containing protein [Rhodothermales bacterium]|nr:T9SS type A sorting domain-containing protein [Rhodothermales bacterium]
MGGVNQALFAQITKGGTPYSFTNPVTTKPKPVVLPEPNIAATLAADQAKKVLGIEIPFRYGVPVDIDYGLDNAGTWEDLPNGDRLWRLEITSPGATSTSLVYSEFAIPPGGKLFLYNKDRSTVVGALTEDNNPDGGSYATRIIGGNTVVLEYQEPSYALGESRIQISRLIHGFRGVFGQNTGDSFNRSTESYGDAASCNVNVNCSVGAPYRDQQRSVVLIQDTQGSTCSGALINNEREDHFPYILTANHCYTDLYGTANWIFYFNYESPTCTNQNGSLSEYIVGASLVARFDSSDFALVSLIRDVWKSYNAYYAGWSATGTTPSSTTSIHHPQGDIKKISLDYDSPSITENGGSSGTTHWEVRWDVGITEDGSSGSPLFDNNKRIIGQLHGGSSFCSVPHNPDWYGRFSVSWDHGSTASERLKDHLDPDNTGISTLNGKNDTRPYAPTNLTVSGCIGCLPHIAWTASSSSNIDHYEVWRRTYPEGWNFFASTSVTSWTDSQATIVASGQEEDNYCYKARAVDTANQKSDFSNLDCVLVEESPPWGNLTTALKTSSTTTPKANAEAAVLPTSYSLEGNFPNPFNSQTEIRFALPKSTHVQLEVFDLMGRKVAQLVDGQMEAGHHTVGFDANRLPGGVYVYRFRAGKFTESGRMVLLK